jgi:hypothetical protein
MMHVFRAAETWMNPRKGAVDSALRALRGYLKVEASAASKSRTASGAGLASQTLNIGADFLTVPFDDVMGRAARRDGRGSLG